MAESNAVENDYNALQIKQGFDQAKKRRDGIRGKVEGELREAMPRQVIPRYLRRALWSKDPLKLHKSIHRAISEGWTREEMVRQVRLISEQNQQTKEYEIQTE